MVPIVILSFLNSMKGLPRLCDDFSDSDWRLIIVALVIVFWVGLAAVFI